MECDILHVWLSLIENMLSCLFIWINSTSSISNWALYTVSVLDSGSERVNSKKRNKYGYVLIVTCFCSVGFGEEWELYFMLWLFAFVLTSGICFMGILTWNKLMMFVSKRRKREAHGCECPDCHHLSTFVNWNKFVM